MCLLIKGTSSWQIVVHEVGLGSDSDKLVTKNVFIR